MVAHSYRAYMDLHDILRSNLRYAVRYFGNEEKLADAAQAGSKKYFEQILSGFQGKRDKSPRTLGKKVAGAVEAALDKPAGWMHQAHPELWTEESADPRVYPLPIVPNPIRAEDAARRDLTRRDETQPHGDRRAQMREDLARGTERDPAWPQVMEWVYDELLVRRSMLEMPTGRKLRDMVTAVLVVLRLEEGEINLEKARRKIDAIL